MASLFRGQDWLKAATASLLSLLSLVEQSVGGPESTTARMIRRKFRLYGSLYVKMDREWRILSYISENCWQYIPERAAPEESAE